MERHHPKGSLFPMKDVVDGIKKQQKKWALDQIIESFPEL